MKELRYINKYFKKYRYKIIVGILITIIARVFSLIYPSYVNKSVTAIELWFRDDPTLDKAAIRDDLIWYIIIIIGAALLSGFFTFLMRQTIINVSRFIEFDLKNEIFIHYTKLSRHFYKQNRTGDLMNRISEDVSQVRMYAGPAVMYSFQTITLFACLVPIMFIKAPSLALYTLLPLPILSYLIYNISRIIHRRSTIVQEFLSSLSTFSQETFSGISVIKAYGLEPRINNQLETLALSGKTKSLDLARINALFFPMMILLIGISNILVIYIGGTQYISGEIASLGIIAEFIIYVNMLTWPVAIVGWVTSIVQRAEASQKRINQFLDIEPHIVDDPLANYPKISKGNIHFKKVSFTYEDTGIKALNSVSFEVEAGETLAIIGKTGSGKSTLLNLLGRLYEPDEGEILIDGNPIKQYAISDLRNAMGAVPQDAFLFSDSIANNISFGVGQVKEKQIIEAATKASVHQNIVDFSKGYETVLGERGITLSGGQKQRISIARALLKDPLIFLFDDCLSAVDTETEEEILYNLDQAGRNKTTIIVSHRISSAKNAHKIIVLDEGAIIQSGKHETLINQGGYYQELYEHQLSEKEN